MDNDLEITPVKIGEDNIGARIQKDGKYIDVDFTLDVVSLREIVGDYLGVEMTTLDAMSVTKLSREQVEIEGRRIYCMLKSLGTGTVASICSDMCAWIDPSYPDTLMLSQEFEANSTRKEEGFAVEEIGQIDTQELFEIAETFREWIKKPVTMTIDLDRLSSQE